MERNGYALLEQFDQKVNRDFYVRRFGVVAGNTAEGECYLQLDLFTDYDALEKEKRLQKDCLRYGADSVRTQY